MSFFESKIPDFLTDRRNTQRQLIFISVFALVFVNLYSPFEVSSTFNLTDIQLFAYSSLVILAGLLIIAISRIILHQVTRKKVFSNGNYILWITAEIISLAAVYVVLQFFFVEEPGDDLLSRYKESLKTTTLVLLFPYTLSYLYLSWQEKKNKLEQLSAEKKLEKPEIPAFIAFKDEKGELKFSVKTEDLLYLEAADNYVIIHYTDGKSNEKFMIRNSMKNLEKELSEFGIFRCHRSYMVNFSRVKIVKKEKDGLVLEIDSSSKKNLPVSETYVNSVMKAFAGNT